jgi:hypothetical protein
VIPYEFSANTQTLLAGTLRLAELRFSRQITLAADSSAVLLSETVETLAARPGRSPGRTSSQVTLMKEASKIGRRGLARVSRTLGCSELG